ncbi:hypothetical protein, partial [Escherichia coli]|uniref:hypothetical protein n=1 Tax=Escherichia coli TaxID=562 RepID=UPI001BC89BA2
PLLIWWTPLCLIRQILTRRFRLYAYVYQGQNGQSITLELLNAKIGFATSGNSQQQQSSNHQNHPEYDDSIPF